MIFSLSEKCDFFNRIKTLVAAVYSANQKCDAFQDVINHP